jgi:hypothetical protein
VGKHTRSRPPRGVDPALALLIRTGLNGNGLITAPMVVLAELVHRRVIHATTDGEDLWRLKYTASGDARPLRKASGESATVMSTSQSVSESGLTNPISHAQRRHACGMRRSARKRDGDERSDWAPWAYVNA